MDEPLRDRRALDLGLELPWLERFPRSGAGGRARQLADQLRRAIAAGNLRPGDRLPASRPLARHLGMARGTVVDALEQLLAEGLLEATQGSGTFVASAAAVLAPANQDEQQWQQPRSRPAVPVVDRAEPGLIDLRPCRPALTEFPIRQWRQCLDQAARARPGSDYADPLGAPALREAIAEQLRRSRGLAVAPETLMICDGALHAMHLIASVYLLPVSASPARVIMEDPGYPLARQLFAATGAQVIDVPVDQQGLDPGRLPSAQRGAQLLYLTPSNQFPTGARLSLARRRALLAWAQTAGALIVEDDYDGEYCYDVEPLPPLAAIGGGQVAYCGSFSKTLFPNLRIGYIMAHPAQIELLSRARVCTGYTGNQVVQQALALFISQGHYRRYVLRMRRRYSAKRRFMREILNAQPRPPTLLGGDSGLNLALRIAEGSSVRSVRALTARARRRGVLVPSLNSYQFARRDQSGLVLGYAALSEREIEASVQAIFAP